ncbi:MAG: hypothetical protein Q607_CBUC00038G0021 [Clostridium butyricum DORA_1]|nr:MAG: hypothetical protein Q607_CBUC00038G0021 [Clostridium butyricum DORA_1]MDU1509981.1 DUF262 domain-containing protein [Clostridium butyricum]
MSIETKTIGNLKGYNFFVPSYQRGYRWTQEEVNKLLDDINEFSDKDDKKYCIQPLIVKKRNDDSYEVVDGQQRLTTIYIFMKIASQEIKSAVPPFKLEYETRSNSAQFLESLCDEELTKKNNNIDFYHIALTYETINKWLHNQEDISVAIQELNTKIRKNVFFIWYELPYNMNSIDMFTKVNLGKIPLTNSELIKALIMNKENFNKCSKEEINKCQTEISINWDKIEQILWNDSFWYFLNDKEERGTRIDMLFNLLAYEENANLEKPVKENENYFSFLVFSQQIKEADDKQLFVKKLWNRLEHLNSEFCQWYSELDMYHMIGYLISAGVSIQQIFVITRGKRKKEIIKGLIEKIKSVTGLKEVSTNTKENSDLYNIANLSYESATDRRKIPNLLLLFNIATLVCKSEKQYRFPFNIYKGKTLDKIKWDIEHIHATADESDEPDDTIGNLVLLDSATNRGYKDSVFKDKRRIIIERESKGLFVPLCTKNVFLKVYSKDTTKMNEWNDSDKKDYVSEINKILQLFFSGGNVDE